ncbi:M14 family metallopeptidase [Pseudomarimonas salicorniae]|uniref:M14 family metallopeptidase n=1 Tax=Pseudomarimonas salicorniae TaxID=2933270 RepID=A0ABT0GJS2_9GAMM|nr:M14 family metallopeptidase [Lysobacter sp. CAU 1642]MCK7594791.1 M14 family metallopeptidase [Lysobacter sp. CAU 1642]
MIRLDRALLAGMALAFVGSAGAQVIHTYTNTETGAERIPLGYPVPTPVASLTPVDGFRDYASLDARLRFLAEDSADLTGHDVGQTANGRVVRAYVVSDADGVDVEGRSEAAFFINASTHAREWGTPEVSTYLVERMVEGANDGGLVRYLLDNARLVIIPVHNIDGFLQTQRFPNQVIIGQDPRAPNEWPRDGRMRRKNMVGVDEILSTFGDHLRGTDLNRNHPPFWGTVTNGGQLTNPNELTFRGAGPHSEPESQALVNASQLAPPSRIRFGVDVHSFSRVFFSSNTGRTRLNQIQSRLFALLSSHHASVPTASGQPNNAFYRDIPDPPNSGIGVAAEYFAYEWLVPSMTLELEPQGSGAEYGGTGASHSGFVLPDSQVRRVREAWAESFLVGFYFMSGPPHLKALRVFDAGSGALLQEQRWVRDPASGRRTLQSSHPGSVVAGQALRVELVFSKPMRYRNADGQVASLPGLSTVAAPIVSRITQQGTEGVDTSSGTWLGDAGFERYRDDTFRFSMSAPAGGMQRFEVATTDMAGLGLDADPSTPADWQDGAWSEWEDAAGVDGDIGGVDRMTASLTVSESGNPAALSLAVEPASVVGEGDRLRLRLLRPASDAGGALQVKGRVGGFAEASVSWASGESGERLLALPVEDDVLAEGDRSLSWQVEPEGSTDALLFSGEVQVLDNDRPGQVVVREYEDARRGLQRVAEGTAALRELVLDGGKDYVGPTNLLTVCQQFDMQAPLVVHGNRARLVPGGSACSLARLQGSGKVELRDLSLTGERPDAVRTLLVDAEGQDLTLHRVVMRDAEGPAARGVGRLEMRQSALIDSAISSLGRAGDFGALEVASADIESSSYLDIERMAPLPQDGFAALLMTGRDVESSLREVAYDPLTFWFIRGRASIGGSVLYDAGGPVTQPLADCDGVRSVGFNVFNRRLTRCFDPTPTDRSVPVEVAARSGPDLAWRMPSGVLLDSSEGCGAVDQRGAPRPQTLTEGATARCDVGPVEQGVNPWRGFWQPERDGHGLDIQTSGNVLTLLWYTYQQNGEPIAYLAAGPLTGRRWQAELLTATRNTQDGTITNTRVGEVSIEFQSDTAATLLWQFDGSMGSSEPIRALDFGGSEARVEVTGSWFPPGEPGNGASIARRGEVTAMALYYYDAGGVLRWALGQGPADDALRMPLSSFTGFCPDCDAVANPVTSQPAGSALLHFRTPGQLVIESDLTYPGGNGGRWTRPRSDFVPLTDPVDNREAVASIGK